MVTENVSESAEASEQVSVDELVPNEIRRARLRVRQSAPDAAPKGSPLGGTPTTPVEKHAKAAQWKVPNEVKNRFVKVGPIYYFPDGAKAFEDHGQRLTTPSENTQVIASLVAIAEQRGWERVIVSGSERFRKEAWRQAALMGLTVRGYRPSVVDQARLAQDRGAARRRPGTPEPPTQDRSPNQGQQIETDLGTHRPAHRPLEPSRAHVPDAEAPIAGRLLESGAARFRHDLSRSQSYFVRLATVSGERTIWGRDLERALGASHSQLQVGDEVVLRRDGREAVSVRFKDTRPDGKVVEREEVKFRTRWSIESPEMRRACAAMAEALCDPDRVSDHHAPELSNARLVVRQAEVMVKHQLKTPAQQNAFVAAVREQLAERLERGQAVPTAVLRARSADVAPREHGEPGL